MCDFIAPGWWCDTFASHSAIYSNSNQFPSSWEEVPYFETWSKIKIKVSSYLFQDIWSKSLTLGGRKTFLVKIVSPGLGKACQVLHSWGNYRFSKEVKNVQNEAFTKKIIPKYVVYFDIQSSNPMSIFIGRDWKTSIIPKISGYNTEQHAERSSKTQIKCRIILHIL